MKPSLIGDRPQFTEILSQKQRGSYDYIPCFSAVIPPPPVSVIIKLILKLHCQIFKYNVHFF